MTATSPDSSPRSLWPGDGPLPAFVSARSRERLLRIALLLTVGVALLAALAALERYRFATAGLRLGAVTPDRFDALGRRRSIVDLLLVLAVAAVAVLWLAWFARIYANLQALGANWIRLSVPSALVSCALPVLNLFMVPLLVGEAWSASDPDGPDRSLPGDRRRPPPLVLLWVGVLILTLVVVGLAEKVAHRTLEQLGPVRSGAPLEALGALLVVAAALLTARLASILTSRQEERARAQVAAEGVEP